MQNLPKQTQTIKFMIDLVSKLKSQIPVHKVCNINAEKKWVLQLVPNGYLQAIISTMKHSNEEY